VVLKSAQPLTALAGYRRLGWPVKADGDRLALVTGTVADVLEVTRPAGAVATAWWHATGSSIPAPPSKAGQAAARWAHLPVSALQPAPALAVLDLLGKAASMTRAPGTLRLPGGAVAVPAAVPQR
jgi:hypothetical protein